MAFLSYTIPCSCLGGFHHRIAASGTAMTVSLLRPSPQLIGISIVGGAWGQATPIQSPQPLSIIRVISWPNALVGAQSPKPSTLAGREGSLAGNREGFGLADVPPEASIEDRLAALEANVKSLKTEQPKLLWNSKKKQGNGLRPSDSERRMRESAVINIRRQLDTLGVGGLHLEWAGVFWLVLGVILATIPSEIAGWLKWFSGCPPSSSN